MAQCGKGGGSAPSPDPQIGKAALDNVQLGKDWLSFARDQSTIANGRQTDLDNLNNQVAGSQLQAMNDSNARSAQQWERYQSMFMPVEDRMVSDALNYDAPEKQAEAAAAAKADVQLSAQQAKEQQAREAAGLGISPTSGRYAGIDRSLDTQTALAEAGAQNNARQQVKAQGMALREGAANFGRGNSSDAAQQLGLGLNAGNSVVGNTVAGENNFRANAGIMSGAYGGAINANSGAANIMQNQYNGQLSAYNAQQARAGQESSALGSAIGGAAGIAAAALI